MCEGASCFMRTLGAPAAADDDDDDAEDDTRCRAAGERASLPCRCIDTAAAASTIPP